MARVLQELYSEAEAKGMEKGRNEGINQGRTEGRIEGVAEGEAIGKIKKSREVIREYLEARFGFFETIVVKEKLKELYNSEILDTVIKMIFTVDTLEKVQNIFDEALKAQEKVNLL